MKKILIIQGHPDQESFCSALANSYKTGCDNAGVFSEILQIGAMEFNSNLAFGYRKRIELEPCLLEAQEKIKAANHIVIVHPVWWGSVPAVFKGFIDRVFLPGFAFSPKENSLWWNKLLSGKTGTIICTMDQPGWYYRFVYGRPSINALKKLTMEFCGISPVSVVSIGPIKHSKEKYRTDWLQKIERKGNTEAKKLERI